MSARILFVDDEPRVLNGLKRLLHPHRGEWDMEFAGNADRAMAVLESGPVDVLVTDLRMPVSSGEDLLRTVLHTYPQTVRIVLSGHADAQTLMSTLGLAHQILCKPCDAEVLVTAIQRALGVRGLLRNERLRALAASIDTLPSLPPLYRRLMEALAREAPLAEIGTIIAKDVGMTAKLLKIANSPILGLSCTVEDLNQAVAILGLDGLKSLVLTHKVFSQCGLRGRSAEFMEMLWARSVVTGGLAHRMARELRASRIDEQNAMMAGMLGGIGQVLLQLLDAGGHLGLVARAGREGLPLEELEHGHFGVTHGEAGAYLLGLWGLPHELVEAIHLQADPERAGPRPSVPLRVLVAARVTLADLEDGAAIPPTRAQCAFLREQFPESQRLAWRRLARERSEGFRALV